jgi:hypothetical protein
VESSIPVIALSGTTPFRHIPCVMRRRHWILLQSRFRGAKDALAF